jgi:large subunit ribosomal protein L27
MFYFTEFVRNASKKTGGSTKNTNCKVKPKRRGWKVQDGHFVQAGHMLATQRTTRFHPGLNVRTYLLLFKIYSRFQI